MCTTKLLISVALALAVANTARPSSWLSVRHDDEQRAKGSQAAPNPPARTPSAKPAPPQRPSPNPPPQRAVPRSSVPNRPPSGPDDHAREYVYPFPLIPDFDWVYRFPYGIYPYSRYYGYPYPPDFYPVPDSESVEASPEAYGSIRLDVPQADATVYVDGFSVGVVGDFNDVTEHLILVPGPHHLELRAPGFETTAFDVRVQTGQTITYRSSMRPIAGPAASGCDGPDADQP
jgi:hypothetical protein